MSEVRLYFDEDAGENAVVQGIRARGFDILTTIEAHHCGAIFAAVIRAFGCSRPLRACSMVNEIGG
ncbi:MAG: hypothetical protein ACLQNE_44285 [Thermoguttaceae bacterium]